MQCYFIAAGKTHPNRASPGPRLLSALMFHQAAQEERQSPQHSGETGSTRKIPTESSRTAPPPTLLITDVLSPGWWCVQPALNLHPSVMYWVCKTTRFFRSALPFCGFI